METLQWFHGKIDGEFFCKEKEANMLACNACWELWYCMCGIYRENLSVWMAMWGIEQRENILVSVITLKTVADKKMLKEDTNATIAYISIVFIDI